MITAVDTNVLLDLLIPGAPHGDESEKALGEAARSGSVMISEPVYAELAASFSEQSRLDDFLANTGVRIDSSRREALYGAGRAWSEYLRRRPLALTCAECGASQGAMCDRCGATIRSRQHVITDFLIGSHAQFQADALLSRDRGYYSTYFPDLKLA